MWGPGEAAGAWMGEPAWPLARASEVGEVSAESLLTPPKETLVKQTANTAAPV